MITLDEAKLRNGIDKVKNDTLRRFSDYISSFTGSWSSDVHPVILGNKILAMGNDWRVYFYVDKGTEPHVIKPKNANMLFFPSGVYLPKTRPVATKTGGSGQYLFGDGLSAAKQVDHPGIKAREITKTMIEEDNHMFLESIHNAVMEAIRSNA